MTEVSVHPRARNCDPSTSHEAADAVQRLARSQIIKIHAALGIGPQGAEQIGDRVGLQAYEVRKRLPELERQCLAVATSVTRKTRTGRSERVWMAS